MTLTVTDLFAGAGGSSTGMVAIDGVEVKIAANHWQAACDVHNLNHQDTDHAVADLHQEDPRYFPRTDILWASPECTKWSQANGNKLPAIEEGLFEDPESSEAAQRSRLLMFDVLRFVEHHRYRRVVVENVVDIAMQAKYRLAWEVWRQDFTRLGYRFRVVSLNSMHAQSHGLPAPQSRDRLYVVAWLKGDRAPDIDRILRPKAWCPTCGEVVESTQAFKPGRTVGRYRAQYVYLHSSCGTVVEPAWLPAAAAIDWSLPGSRIGDRKDALAPKTRARIAAGIARYWRPFTLEAAGNTFERRPGVRTWPADEVLTTLHTTASKALAVPVEGRDGKDARPLNLPARTQTTRLETALLTRQYGIPGGNAARHSTPADEAMRTLTANAGNMSLLEPPAPFVAELRGGSCDARAIGEPLGTVTASGNHHGLVEPPLVMDNNHTNRARPAGDELPTQTTATTKALITPSGGSWHDDARPAEDVLRTLTTRDAYALLAPYYSGSEVARSALDTLGALTTRDRYALVHRHNTGGAEMLTPALEEMRTLTTGGHQSVVTPSDLDAAESLVDDCLFRMLQPHEVAAGMAFPGDYAWQPYSTRKISNRDLVKLAGNAVTPPAARDLMAAVVESLT